MNKKPKLIVKKNLYNTTRAAAKNKKSCRFCCKYVDKCSVNFCGIPTTHGAIFCWIFLYDFILSNNNKDHCKR